MVRTIHAVVKGRVRYKVAGLYRSHALKRQLELRLLEIEEIAQNNLLLAQKGKSFMAYSELDILSFENKWLQSIDSRLLGLEICLETRLLLIKALGGGF